MRRSRRRAARRCASALGVVAAAPGVSARAVAVPGHLLARPLSKGLLLSQCQSPPGLQPLLTPPSAHSTTAPIARRSPSPQLAAARPSRGRLLLAGQLRSFAASALCSPLLSPVASRCCTCRRGPSLRPAPHLAARQHLSARHHVAVHLIPPARRLFFFFFFFLPLRYP